MTNELTWALIVSLSCLPLAGCGSGGTGVMADAGGSGPTVDGSAGADAPPGAEGGAPLSGGTCPGAGTACQGNERCSSGDAIDIACRDRLVCSGGRWMAEPQARSRCGGTSTPCPASPVHGTACSLLEQFCTYANGTACACTEGCDSGAPQAGCQKHAPTWGCEDRTRIPGCPAQLPHSGTSCSGEGKDCWYTAACRSQVARCHEGRWAVTHDQPGCA